MQNNHKTSILYALGIGLLASDLIPTPADAFYFNYQRTNKQKLEENKITPKQYWQKDALGYYGFNAFWWTSVLGISYFLGKDFNQKRNLMIGVIAGGVVITVLHKNIEKDTKYYNDKNNSVNALI